MEVTNKDALENCERETNDIIRESFAKLVKEINNAIDNVLNMASFDLENSVNQCFTKLKNSVITKTDTIQLDNIANTIIHQSGPKQEEPETFEDVLNEVNSFLDFEPSNQIVTAAQNAPESYEYSNSTNTFQTAAPILPENKPYPIPIIPEDKSYLNPPRTEEIQYSIPIRPEEKPNLMQVRPEDNPYSNSTSQTSIDFLRNSYNTSIALNNRPNIHQPDGTRIIQKNERKKDYTQEKTFTKPPNRYNCKECSFTTTNRDMVDTHVKRVHRKEGLFTCQICSFATCYEGRLLSHTQKKECFKADRPKEELYTKNGNKYVCNECFFSTSLGEMIDLHCKRNHQQGGFKCTECGYTSSQEGRVTTHMKTQHNNYGKPIG